MHHITGADMKRVAVLAEAQRNVTHVAQDHITGSFGELPRNVTHELGELFAPLRLPRHITFGQPERRVEPAARGSEPVDVNVDRAPSCLERFLLVLAYEVKPQRSTVAEAYPRIRHGGRVHP